MDDGRGGALASTGGERVVIRQPSTLPSVGETNVKTATANLGTSRVSVASSCSVLPRFLGSGGGCS